MTAAQLADIIAQELEERDDVATVDVSHDNEADGDELTVTTQGGTAFVVQILPKQ